ncbi:MAG: hypothetical protein PGN13_08215 [Patulibacter minatonensis]
MRPPRPTFANLTALLALFVALGGTSYAVTQLPKGSVGTEQLKGKAVTNAKLATGAVTTDKLASGVIVSGPRGPRGAEGPTGPAGKDGATGASVTAGPWQPIQFVNGWGNYGGYFETAAYRKDSLGMVELRGAVARGTAPAAYLPLGVLPEGIRPAKDHIFGVLTGPEGVIGRVDVQGNGQILWVSGSTTAAGNYTTLSTIRFPAG